MIGKDDPSTCESLTVHQKVKEWVQHVQMPTVDEECESVTNEEMLNCVRGSSSYNAIKQQPSECTSDSGIDPEHDSGLSKMLLKQEASSYMSHQAAEDMFHVKVDETSQPNPQNITVGSDSINASQSNSNFLSSSNKLDPSVTSPSANDSFPSLVTEGNHTNGDSRQPLSLSNNTKSIEAAGNSGYIDHYVASNIDNTDPLALHSTNSDTFMTTSDRSYADQRTLSNTNQQLSITTADERSYVESYTTINKDVEIDDSKLSYSTNNQLITNVLDSSYLPVDHAIAVQQDGELDSSQQVKPGQNATITHPPLIQNPRSYWTESDV